MDTGIKLRISMDRPQVPEGISIPFVLSSKSVKCFTLCPPPVVLIYRWCSAPTCPHTDSSFLISYRITFALLPPLSTMLQTFTSMKNNNTCLIHLRNERPFRLTIDSQLPNDLPIRPHRLRVSQKGTGKQRKIAGGEGGGNDKFRLVYSHLQSTYNSIFKK